MRDKRQTLEHFNTGIAFYEKAINKQLEQIRTNSGIKEGNRPLAAYILFDYYIRYIKRCYSRGDDLNSLKSTMKLTIDALEMIHREIMTRPLKERDNGSQQQYVNLGLDNYFDYFLMLAFTINLELPQSEVLRLIHLISHEGEDALLDRIAKKFIPQRTIGPEVRFPRPYQPLFDALDAAPDKQPKLVKTFLDKWYPSLKRIGWWGGFEKGSDAYCGYWCFEAALVVRLFNIDDTSFADHPYYPKDLAAHGRAS